MSQRRNTYETTYARIEALLKRPLANLQPEDVIRLQAPGFMDLTVEVLSPCPETGATILSMCHYYEVNRDLCRDPEMTVRLFHPGSPAFRGMVPSSDLRRGRAEALTFEQSIPPIYQVVYPAPGKYVPSLSRDLNAFLGLWLRNLKAQGHQPILPKS